MSNPMDKFNMDWFRLDGKVAMVTGANQGLGMAYAVAFAKAGADLFIPHFTEDVSEIKALIEKEGRQVHFLRGDLTDKAYRKACVDECMKQYGRIDILVNNAGISHIGLFTDMTPEQWQHVLNVNLGSVLNCTHLAVPAMVHNKTGVILNISSMWGEAGASCEAVYSASKGGINAFTKAMAKELGPSGIRVNAIACGVIDTEMNACFSEEERAELADEIALMRFGKPEEVGRFALTLANKSASFLTGQIITLDGGML